MIRQQLGFSNCITGIPPSAGSSNAWLLREQHLQRLRTSAGRLADLAGSSPTMVCVLPLPVWPYAKIEELYPFRQFSTIGFPTAAQPPAMVRQTIAVLAWFCYICILMSRQHLWQVLCSGKMQ